MQQATTVPMCQGMLWWVSNFGLPDWLITDGGPHYINHAMEMLAEKMKMHHHATLTYCPWANGSMEVFGRELVRTVRVLLSEFRLGIDE